MPIKTLRRPSCGRSQRRDPVAGVPLAPPPAEWSGQGVAGGSPLTVAEASKPLRSPSSRAWAPVASPQQPSSVRASTDGRRQEVLVPQPDPSAGTLLSQAVIGRAVAERGGRGHGPAPFLSSAEEERRRRRDEAAPVPVVPLRHGHATHDARSRAHAFPTSSVWALGARETCCAQDPTLRWATGSGATADTGRARAGQARVPV